MGAIGPDPGAAAVLLKGAHPGTATGTAGVVGVPGSDPARFGKIPIHAGSESGAPGAVHGCALWNA